MEVMTQFSIVLIKYHDQKELEEEITYLGYVYHTHGGKLRKDLLGRN